MLEELEDEQLDEMWTRVPTTFTKAGEETLGFASAEKKPWMSSELWQAVEERQLINLKLTSLPNDSAQKDSLKEQYTSLRNTVKRLARRDKRRVAEELAQRAKTAAQRKDMRVLYDATSRLSGRRATMSKKPLKAKIFF
ncbi:hypothetical protein O0L34_g19146 [Tuta absoluta]|nr:hypothetical protein O0L34_g19146 [Tuta absoluta]